MRRGGLRIAAATAVAAGVALAATPAWARTAAPKGACKLLTVREVGEILGTPAGSGKSSTKTLSGAKSESCKWKAKKKGTGGIEGKPLSLEIAVQAVDRGADSAERAGRSDDRAGAADLAGAATGRSWRPAHAAVGQGRRAACGRSPVPRR